MADQVESIIAAAERATELKERVTVLESELAAVHSAIHSAELEYGGDIGALKAAEDLSRGQDVYVTCALAERFSDVRQVVKRAEVVNGVIISPDPGVPMHINAFWAPCKKTEEFVVLLYAPEKVGE